MFNDNRMKIIGENIKKIRNLRGIGQKELATMLNLTAASVSNWERGKRLPDIENLISLCEILQISSDELLGINKNNQQTATQITSDNIKKTESKTSTQIASSIQTNNELEEDLIENFRKLNKKNKYRSITEIIDLVETQNKTDKETVKKEKRMEA